MKINNNDAILRHLRSLPNVIKRQKYYPFSFGVSLLYMALDKIVVKLRRAEAAFLRGSDKVIAADTMISQSVKSYGLIS